MSEQKVGIYVHAKAGSFKDGVIHVGHIEKSLVHFGDDAREPLCRYDQIESGTLSTVSTDFAKVTCQSCIEWRHA